METCKFDTTPVFPVDRQMTRDHRPELRDTLGADTKASCCKSVGGQNWCRDSLVEAWERGVTTMGAGLGPPPGTHAAAAKAL